MSTDEDTSVHDILNTLLVPTYPPNRSQWRKLELALKFINLSKQSAKQSKSYTDPATGKNNTKSASHPREPQRNALHVEPAAKKPRMRMKEPCKTVSIVHKEKNSGSWTKIKDSVRNML